MRFRMPSLVALKNFTSVGSFLDTRQCRDALLREAQQAYPEEAASFGQQKPAAGHPAKSE